MAVLRTEIPLRLEDYDEVDGVLYPCTEEEPLVQSDWHDDTVFDARGMLKAHFADRPEVFVGSDMFVFWQEGNPRKKEAPDLFVCLCTEPRDRERKSFYVWRELSGPSFILEVLSESTDRMDWGRKLRVYRDEMRVAEYFLFDPRERPGQLWGFRLSEGEYVPIEPDARGRIWSQQVALWFGTDFRGFVQTWEADGTPIIRPLEALALAKDEARRAEEAERRVQDEARRAEAAEARVRELEARLRQLEGDRE